MLAPVLAVVALIAAGCPAGTGNVFSLEVGQCFDEPDLEAEEVSDVRIVECDQAHDNEVYAVFDLVGSAYPGSQDVFDAAAEGCAQRFSAYVGSELENTDLGGSFLIPSEKSWTDSDDREVVCYLFDGRLEKLAGTMRSTG